MFSKSNSINKTEVSDNLNRLKLIVRKAAAETTAHGLPRIILSDYPAFRLMWLIVSCASSVVCAYLIYASVLSFLDWKVVSTIEIIPQSPLQFPTVSYSVFLLHFKLFLF
jgi:hypothetical protein